MEKTFKLFIASFSLMVVTFLFSIFWRALNLGENKVSLLGAGASVAFGLSIAGLIFGLSEIKKSKSKKTIIGISGNALVVLLFIYIIYVAMTLNALA